MSITLVRLLPESAADVPALYEVLVVLIVTARSYQDAQKIQIVAQVLDN